MIDFKLVKETKLRQRGELDRLFGVSYPMVNAYMTGKSYPRGKNRERATLLVKVLTDLLERGKLPFGEDKDTEARQAAIEKIAAFVEAKTTPQQ